MWASSRRPGSRITGTGPEGEPRVLEWQGPRFFMGTLFVPQASSTVARPHPLIVALLEACGRT